MCIRDSTVLVVEHDEDTMRAADYIGDVGPGAGIHGGEIVAAGSVDDLIAEPRSITGQYLSGKKKIPVPAERRTGSGNFLRVYGAAENNLKNIDVEIPLGTFTCVTGVSGSGKSSLVNEIIHKKLASALNHARKMCIRDSIQSESTLSEKSQKPCSSTGTRMLSRRKRSRRNPSPSRSARLASPR